MKAGFKLMTPMKHTNDCNDTLADCPEPPKCPPSLVKEIIKQTNKKKKRKALFKAWQEHTCFQKARTHVEDARTNRESDRAGSVA